MVGVPEGGEVYTERERECMRQKERWLGYTGWCPRQAMRTGLYRSFRKILCNM